MMMPYFFLLFPVFLISILIDKSFEKSKKKDFDIKGHAPVLNVVYIIFNPLAD